MTQRRFEIFIAVILTVICYLGDYYLKEPSLHQRVAIYSLSWHALNILWLLSMVIFGYWGLNRHEFKWLKVMWLKINFIVLFILLANKLLSNFFHHTFIPDATSAFIRTPFFFLVVAYFPRWFIKYKPTKEN